MSLTSTTTLQLIATLIGTTDFNAPTFPLNTIQTMELTDGTGLGQADKLWASQSRTLTATTSENIDLAGSLTDKFGASITFARIKKILIVFHTTTAGYTLEVGGAASNTWATMFGAANDYIKVRGGGLLFAYAPDVTAYAVTAGTGDILKINNPNAASITYSIVLIGASV